MSEQEELKWVEDVVILLKNGELLVAKGLFAKNTEDFQGKEKAWAHKLWEDLKKNYYSESGVESKTISIPPAVIPRQSNNARNIVIAFLLVIGLSVSIYVFTRPKPLNPRIKSRDITLPIVSQKITLYKGDWYDTGIWVKNRMSVSVKTLPGTTDPFDMRVGNTTARPYFSGDHFVNEMVLVSSMEGIEGPQTEGFEYHVVLEKPSKVFLKVDDNAALSSINLEIEIYNFH